MIKNKEEHRAGLCSENCAHWEAEWETLGHIIAGNSSWWDPVFKWTEFCCTLGHGTVWDKIPALSLANWVPLGYWLILVPQFPQLSHEGNKSARLLVSVSPVT